MVSALLDERLPVSLQHLRQGLLSVSLPGRFQLVQGEVPLIVDVAHNPQAAAALADNLRQMPVSGKTLAVAALLTDKDLGGVVAELHTVIDQWYVAGLDVWRGGEAGPLAAEVEEQGGNVCGRFDSVSAALAQARRDARSGDRIVVFGSFHTVAEVLATDV
jgi:dihydrofolate synthase/folylpolyglutamate synthase